MQKVSLNGVWDIESKNKKYVLKGDVPGTDFGNLVKQGIIVSPLISGIEEEALKIAENDFSFSRSFDIPKEILAYNNVSLRCESIDTLADVYVNGNLVASLNNAYIPLNVNIKAQLKEGTNNIKIEFHSAYNYIREKQSQNKLPTNFNGVNGIPYIRKPGCHFGWDWGPCVPYCGILDDIYLKAFNEEIKDIAIRQETNKEMSKLYVSCSGAKDIYILTPTNEKISVKNGFAEIKNPVLWYTKEMSNKETQPLYKVVFKNEEEEIIKEIGLRSLYLDQSKDEYGTNFCFILNGEKVFAKGANLIPFAAIYEDITKEMVDYYINLALESNFNIIRIWGGGSYIDEYFLSQCDKLGILVWQDFCFACQLYPLSDKDFKENVINEITYNVIRESNHPCLALFCGNNEIETMYAYMNKNTKLLKAYKEFFYDTCPDILKDITNVSYIPTSPVGSDFMKDISSDNHGDTHMWNVWHGLKKLDYYGKRYSRFLSEFGLESLPSMKAISTFASGDELDINSKSFNAHQKCGGGNKKMLFYLTEFFDFPKYFEALPYLTGIVQAECIKNAAVHFRQNKGRCNGAIYWQYNDVWNCPSWSSVDFEGVPKALQYKAKEFFSPITLTCSKEQGRAVIFAHNDTLSPQEIDLKIQEYDIKTDEIVSTFEQYLSLDKNSSEYVMALKTNKDYALKITCNGESIYEIMDRPYKLPLKKVNFNTYLDGNKLTISADTFAYDVCIDSDAIAKDNYFSLLKGESKTVELSKEPTYVNIICANNIEYKKNRIGKACFRFFYRLKPINVARYVFYSLN